MQDSAVKGLPSFALGKFAAYHAECLLKELAPRLSRSIRLAAIRMVRRLVFHLSAIWSACSMTWRPNSCASSFASSGRGPGVEDAFPLPLSTADIFDALDFRRRDCVGGGATSESSTTSSCSSMSSSSSSASVSEVGWPLLLRRDRLESRSRFDWL